MSEGLGCRANRGPADGEVERLEKEIAEKRRRRGRGGDRVPGREGALRARGEDSCGLVRTGQDRLRRTPRLLDVARVVVLEDEQLLLEELEDFPVHGIGYVFTAEAAMKP